MVRAFLDWRRLCSLTEPGDKVLVIENGVYGEGFADFVTMYGGVPEFYHADRLNAIDPEALSFLFKRTSLISNSDRCPL